MDRQLIKSIRLFNGLSQSEFSVKIGVSESTISRIESGERSISDRVRMGVVRNFEISPELLKAADSIREFN